MKREGYIIRIHDTSIILDTNTNERHDQENRHKYSHYKILGKVLDYLKSRGFDIEQSRYNFDESIINNDGWAGIKKNLEFQAERYPAGFRLEFYQNVNTKNPHGGYYDFDKFKMTPYLIRLMFINERKYITNFLKELGCEENLKPNTKLAEDFIKWDYVDSWHYPQKSMDFNLSDLDGKTREKYNSKDRDDNWIYNGQVKYFYDYSSHLSRGKVYTNLNNMWWVIVNKNKVSNVASFNLFDPTPEDFKIRRKRRPYLPKDAFKKMINKKETNANKLMGLLALVYERMTAKEFKVLFNAVCKRLGLAEGERKTMMYYKTSGDKYKVFLNASVKAGSRIQIVYRYEGGHYILLEYNGNRIFEYDTRAFNIDLKKLNQCYLEYKQIWDKL